MKYFAYNISHFTEYLGLFIEVQLLDMNRHLSSEPQRNISWKRQLATLVV